MDYAWRRDEGQWYYKLCRKWPDGARNDGAHKMPDEEGMRLPGRRPKVRRLATTTGSLPGAHGVLPSTNGPRPVNSLAHAYWPRTSSAEPQASQPHNSKVLADKSDRFRIKTENIEQNHQASFGQAIHLGTGVPIQHD